MTLFLSYRIFQVLKVRFLPGLLPLLFLFSSISPVLAQSSYDLGRRIDHLENEVETLSRAVYRGELPPAGSASRSAKTGGGGADSEIRLQQVERELRELRGLLERNSHDVRTMRAEMERVTSDLELRLNELEGGGRSSSRSPSPARAPALGSGGGAPDYTTGNASPSNGGKEPYQWSSKNPSNKKGGSLGSYVPSGGSDSAAAAYESAFSLVKSSQYGAAEKGFSDFLAQYPDHVLAPNAHYWLGETYYVRGKFEKASRIFAEGYQKNPKGSKADDNLLKLGMSLAGLGKTADACVALGQLVETKSNANTPVMRRAEQEKTRLAC